MNTDHCAQCVRTEHTCAMVGDHGRQGVTTDPDGRDQAGRSFAIFQ